MVHSFINRPKLKRRCISPASLVTCAEVGDRDYYDYESVVEARDQGKSTIVHPGRSLRVEKVDAILLGTL